MDGGSCVFRRSLGPGDAGEDVACLQRYLSDRKVYDGPKSAWYGPKTIQAVKKWQEELGLVSDGWFGSDCKEAYHKQCAKEKNDKKTIRQASFGGECSDSSSEGEDGSRKGGSKHVLRGLKVALDVGHGAHPLGFEVGSRGVRGLEEFELNTVLSREIARRLRKKGARVSVFRYDRNSSERPWLPDRGKKAQGHHLFLSCHHNAHDGRTQGTETLVDVDGTDEDVELAHHVQKSLVHHLWSECTDAACFARKDRGVKWQNLGVLGTVPLDVEAACLVEPYFMDDNTNEGYSRIGPDFSKLAAKGVVEGVQNYWIEKKKPRYRVLVHYENEEQMERLQGIQPEAWCVRRQGYEQQGCEHDEIHVGTYSLPEKAQAQLDLLREHGFRTRIRSTAEE